VDSLARRGNQAGCAPAPSGLCSRAAPCYVAGAAAGWEKMARRAGRSASAEPGGPAAAAQTCSLVSRRKAPGDVLACRGCLAFAAVVVRGLVTPPQRVPVLAARRTARLALAVAFHCIIGTPDFLERVVVATTSFAVLLGHRIDCACHKG